ncbi:MAG: acyltransferase family protein [Pseudomonadota bacterium]
MKYRAEIDGLRALAVLPVIVFHAELGFFAGGFAGVDVFFVISGFLITGILLDDLAAERFSILRFYERRARRILPALCLVTLACFPVALVLLDPRSFARFAESAIAASLFYSNIYFWQTLDYFNSATAQLPLIHTWSLAVEEQYYFFFPPLLWLLWQVARRIGGDWVPWALSLGAIGSFALAVLGAELELRSNFYLLPSRAWELLAGSLAALHVQRRGLPTGRWTDPAAALGLVLLAGSFQFMDENVAFPGPWTLVPVLGTVLLLLCARPETLTGRLLSLPPIVGIGLISYSAYLWHQPLFAFARAASIDRPSAIGMIGLGVVSLGLAWLSWRYVEQPFRRGGWLTERQVFAAALALILTPAAAGFAATSLGDLNRNLFIARLDDDARARWFAWEKVRGAHGRVTGQCHFAAPSIDEAVEARLLACTESRGRAILVLGDSHAGDIYNALARTLPERTVMLLTEGGCRPGRRYETCHPWDLLGYLAAKPGVFERVVYSQAGFWYWIADRDPPIGRWSFAVSNGEGSVNEALIEETAAFVEALHGLAPTVWLGPRFEPHVNLGKLYRRPPGPVAMNPALIAQIEEIDAAIGVRVAAWQGEPHYVSQLEAVTMDPSTEVLRDGVLLYNDADHWSPAGERFFGERIVQALGLTQTAP